MKSLRNLGVDYEGDGKKRDSLLLKLLRTLPRPPRKRVGKKVTLAVIGDEQKKRPASKGRVHKGRTRN